MTEQIGPQSEEFKSKDPSEVLAQLTEPTEVGPTTTESEPASPERQRPGHEELTVTYLNTSFSEAFDHPEGLNDLLLKDQQPHENSVFAFSEVTKPQREAVASALEERGYEVVLPGDNDLDLVWAVGPGLQIEASDAHLFPRKGLRRIASRKGSKAYRHVGIQDLTVATPQGSKIRLGHERLSPWVVEPVRRMQLRDTEKVLNEQFQPDDDVLLTVNGGDMNHIGPFRKPDDRMWSNQENWEPVLKPGTPTHTAADKYRVSGSVFRALGRKSDETQLDAAYARPRNGTKLVDLGAEPDIELSANQIGYETNTIKVSGTDHYAVQTKYRLPVPQRPESAENET